MGYFGKNDMVGVHMCGALWVGHRRLFIRWYKKKKNMGNKVVNCVYAWVNPLSQLKIYESL